eukprot:scaffold1501_cov352-Pavlova_lutheri.AAC.19
MLIRLGFTALLPRPSPPTEGKGRSTAQQVDRRRHDQRRTNAVEERSIEFDIRLSNSLEYTTDNTLDGIEHLRLFKSAVHALYYRTLTKSSPPHRNSPIIAQTHRNSLSKYKEYIEEAEKGITNHTQ